MNALTFGDIKQGDYIQCGEKPEIYHIELMEWFDNGKLRHFKMTDKNGKSKKYSHMTKGVEFTSGSIVYGFEESESGGDQLKELENEIYHLRAAMKIAARNIDRNNPGQAKKHLVKALERES